MAHEIARLMLEHAQTFLDRTEAVRVALSLGMPLNEIQDYLDWLDQIGSSRNLEAQKPGEGVCEAPPSHAEVETTLEPDSGLPKMKPA
jgi:DNA-binding transcriptional MerR regulator